MNHPAGKVVHDGKVRRFFVRPSGQRDAVALPSGVRSVSDAGSLSCANIKICIEN